jgi:hypothetical protein
MTGNRHSVFYERKKMRVLIFGSKDWNDYNELIRQVTVLIDDRKHFYPDDKEYVLYILD